MSISDDQVRFNILELLYNRKENNPAGSGVDRAIIQDALKLDEKQLDNNMSYLEEKSLVSLVRLSRSQWMFAKITVDGVDVIENKERYTDKFSFTQAATSHASDGSEDFSKILKSQTKFPEQLSDAFKRALDQVRVSTLPVKEREKIEKQLRSLEKELQKTPKTDLAVIQRDWEWLKKNANSSTQYISNVVLEAIKIALAIQ
jgi:hypothetical protein